jgi:hypothetical protein
VQGEVPGLGPRLGLRQQGLQRHGISLPFRMKLADVRDLLCRRHGSQIVVCELQRMGHLAVNTEKNLGHGEDLSDWQFRTARLLLCSLDSQSKPGNGCQPGTRTTNATTDEAGEFIRALENDDSDRKIEDRKIAVWLASPDWKLQSHLTGGFHAKAPSHNEFSLGPENW